MMVAAEDQPRTILAYSDKLFTPSESFIPRGYSAFSRLKPVFIGHEQRGDPPPGTDTILLGPLHGPGGEIDPSCLKALSPPGPWSGPS
ncbi:MAG: hypothetical protein AAFQ18_08655, partial [Pseudomonadota bacterium]